MPFTVPSTTFSQLLRKPLIAYNDSTCEAFTVLLTSRILIIKMFPTFAVLLFHWKLEAHIKIDENCLDVDYLKHTFLL